jgi:putative thiamine transport system substrate-binding protein
VLSTLPALPLAAALRPARAQAPAIDWPKTLAAARGQTVYWNAWGGGERTNAYIQWAAGEVQQRFGVKLEHVKLADTVEAVRRVRAEKAAGRTEGGSVDMVWINGENFLAMKREGLLFGPFAESLPSFAFVDVAGKPTTRIDFGEPVEGLEAPWGMAQLTFFADAQRVPKMPMSVAELIEWARANPGRFTYPKPPQFHGTTFVKQVMLEAAGAERAAFYRPLAAGETFARATAPGFAALDALHPHLWKGGRQFPPSVAVMRQMLADGELAMSLTFNPNEAANHVASKALPAGVRSWQFRGGTIGNTHFLAIPFNARAKEGAMAVIDFLLSPAAQARKADIRHWGDPTVLAVDRLPAALRQGFDDAAAAPGSVVAAGPVLPEPQGSWVEPMEREWLRRYGA